MLPRASPALGITLDSTVTIALAAEDVGGGQKHLGLSVSLVPGKSFVLAQGETEVSLEVDASWVDPAVPPGLTVLVLKGTVASLDLVPGVSVAGIGMRFRKPAGPLLDLGAVSIDAIAFHLYGEATAAGVGGGARIRLDGLAVAPGGGGHNGVANALMNDAGKSASPASRPSFSPSLGRPEAPHDRGSRSHCGPATRPAHGGSSSSASSGRSTSTGSALTLSSPAARSPRSACCSPGRCRYSASTPVSTGSASRGPAATSCRSAAGRSTSWDWRSAPTWPGCPCPVVC